MNTTTVNSATPGPGHDPQSQLGVPKPHRSAHHAPPTTNTAEPAADPTDTPDEVRVPQPRTESPGTPPDTSGHQSGVFSPGRLRAHRDLAGLTRDVLATITGVPVTVIIDYERGTHPPTDRDLTILVDALHVTADALQGPPGADQSIEYWQLICASMPPMTSDELASVVTILRRIDQRQREEQHHAQPPDPNTSCR